MIYWVKQKYDLVAVGDTTIDTFIRLHEASIHCDLNHKNCRLCMSFADKIPYETLDVVPAVGNSSNVAVGAARLGLRTAILTAIGRDYYGDKILETYRKEKVGREFVKINRGEETNNHFVLNFKAERTILIKHHRYQYFEPAAIGAAPWVYFSSMGEHAALFTQKLARHLRAHPQIKMGFNPGTFQLKMGAKKLKDIYRHTHVLFVNREEACKILNIKNQNVKLAFKGLHKLGPKIVAITDGPKGAYGSDGERQYFMPIYPDPKPPFERTGCGDSFASGFMAALAAGRPMAEAFLWGPANAVSVLQHTGAQKGLLSSSQLRNLLRNAPKNYHPRKI